MAKIKDLLKNVVKETINVEKSSIQKAEKIVKTIKEAQRQAKSQK